MHKIRISEQDIKNQQKKLREQLSGIKTSTAASINVTVSLAVTDKEKALLEFTQEAMNKIKAFVRLCNKEIAWHGTVTKHTVDKRTVYTVNDVFMFPQIVTAATVKGVPDKYALWNAQLPNDIYNHMRFHGHSHVNMGASPSGVDTNYQEEMIETLEDFYIFLIINKRDDMWVKIVDVEDNIVYDKGDVEITVQGSTEIDDWASAQIEEFLSEEKVVARTVATAPITGTRGATASTAFQNYQQMALSQIDARKQAEADALKESEDSFYAGYYGSKDWYKNYM